MARKLRAVTDEDKPARALTVAEAAKTGDMRKQLVAMRDRVARDIDNPNTPARDLAALTRRYHEFAKEIQAMDAEDEDDDIGEAAATPDEEFAVT